VLPHASFETCPPLDYLLVPGGEGTRAGVEDAALLDFLRHQAASCKTVLSVCTGSLLLEAAGLLKGRQATTHWGALARLRRANEVQVVESRYTMNEGIWCSAGVSAGIDMTLRFIAMTAGDEVAGKVQFATEYYPEARVYGRYRDHAQAPAYLRHPSSSLVVYAKDIQQVAAFYQRVLQLAVAEEAPSHVLLEGGGYEIVVHAIPEAIAADIVIASPPQPREETALKPSFVVADLAALREAAIATGGHLAPAETAWRWRGALVIDGWDPEGNRVQFKVPA
jgi:putative intracellular protease/amidase/predicted enzyme related to lactoylglutathione lyase